MDGLRVKCVPMPIRIGWTSDPLVNEIGRYLRRWRQDKSATCIDRQAVCCRQDKSLVAVLNHETTAVADPHDGLGRNALLCEWLAHSGTPLSCRMVLS